MESEQHKKGFTIIEVVLVLAIAGLIFLMVFIAYPALRRAQADQQRRQDYAFLSTEVSNFAVNNNGKLSRLLGAGGISDASAVRQLDPSQWVNKQTEGEDPDGYLYNVKVVNCGPKTGDSNCTTITQPPRSHDDYEETRVSIPLGKDTMDIVPGSEVYVVLNANCGGYEDGHAFPRHDDSARAFAIYGYLESGTKTYCANSK